MSLIWAHRGASGYAPENTLEAFKLAVDMNADGIELDVQLTKDNVLVVSHDEMIDRVTNSKGFIKDYTYQQLLEINFNNHMDEKYPFCKIATLEEVLQLIKPTNLTINIELKTGVFHYPNIEKMTLELVDKYDMNDRVIYSSFNHQTIVNILQLKEDANCGFLHSDGIIDIASYAKKYNVKNLHPAYYFLIDQKYVKDAFENGLKINSWTLNDPMYIKAALMLNINAIITNYPDLAIKLRSELSK